MDNDSCFLTLSIMAIAFTLLASFRVRRIGYLIIPYFFLTWMITELAWFHMIAQSGVAAWHISQGALTSGDGQLGVVFTALSLFGLFRLHKQSQESETHYEQVLQQHYGTDYIDEIDTQRQHLIKHDKATSAWWKPFHMRRPGVRVLHNISYGDDKERNILDIYLPENLPDKPCPVLFQIHGGGWTIGNKNQQALPLIYHLASRGWICISINYRLSPKHRFPTHILDVKKALAWTKNHISEYGGDPEFIIATGGSAGGHLSSLLTLTANNKELQPGFETVDTRVQGCIPFYGVYDFIDRNKVREAMPIIDFLADYVMPCKPDEDKTLWDLASPIANVNDQVPPMFVIQGSHDSLAFVEESRCFVSELRAKSNQPILYAELTGAQHAFEIFHSVRTEHTLSAATKFVEILYGQYLRQKMTLERDS